MSCNHEWRQIHEEALIGGHFPTGWECRLCKEYVSHDKLTPAGLAGTVTKEHILIGPNGGCGTCSDNTVYSRQILHEDGTLTVERPERSAT